MRCALAAGDMALAERLAQGVDQAGLPLHDHAYASARALIGEAHGDLRNAAERYEDAAARWDGFGARLEHANAILGQGRCLAALDDPSADRMLREARALFDDMDARPSVTECDSLIAQVSRLSS